MNAQTHGRCAAPDCDICDGGGGPVVELRSNLELLDELKVRVHEQPKFRYHANPQSVMWLAISVGHLGLDGHVTLVPDPAVTHPGLGWVEEISLERWRGLLALVGKRVHVEAHLPIDDAVHRITGRLFSLSDREAVVEEDDGSSRYLPWITIKPEEPIERRATT